MAAGHLVALAALVVLLAGRGTAEAPFYASGTCASALSPNSTLELSVDDATGQFELLVAGKVWFTSAPIAVHSHGVWYSTAHKSLVLVSASTTTGQDELGRFQRSNLQWSAASAASAAPVVVNTSFIVYPSRPNMVAFELSFPEGLANTSIGDTNRPAACFPTLSTSAGQFPALGFVTQARIFGNVDSGVGPAQFPQQGVQGGTPTVLMDLASVNRSADVGQVVNTLVLSPTLNFKIGLQTIATPSNSTKMPHTQCDGMWSAGLNGLTTSIPAGFAHRTIAVVGCGLHDALRVWGTALRIVGGKENSTYAAAPDVTVDKLSYWTDNGAGYYYLARASSFEKRLHEVNDWLLDKGIPVTALQIDSWWYYKDLIFDGGLLNWEAMPQVFPHGLDTFYKELKRPMIAHNRWFSSFKASDYVQKNFSFSVQGEVAFPSGSLDDVVSLFDYVMRHAADWGLKVYEQDWLTLQYLQNDFPRSDVFAGSRWLNGMGLAAKKHNLRIQYCMPQPSDYHMSAQIEAVNQIRVSNDYPSEPEQWRIGKTSLFAWAVGLFPFKDVFWTTQKEPGNVYFRQEYNPELQVLVSTLSTGPVGFGDMEQDTNITLLMMCCMADGTILKPDKPATAIGSTFTPAAPAGEVWATHVTVEVSNGSTPTTRVSWNYILASGLTAAYALQPADLDIPLAVAAAMEDHIYGWNGQLQSTPVPFNASAPLALPLSVPADPKKHWPHNLFVVAPQLGGQWRVLGEAGKFVLSGKRLRAITTTDNFQTLQLHLHGASGEQVAIVFRRGTAAAQTATATIGSDGTATMLLQ